MSLLELDRSKQGLKRPNENQAASPAAAQGSEWPQTLAQPLEVLLQGISGTEHTPTGQEASFHLGV